jgi:hypothetical protein
LLQESYADIIECESWGPTESNSPDTEIFASAINALIDAKEAGVSSLVGIDCDGIMSLGNGGPLADDIVVTFLSLLVEGEIPFFCMTSMPSSRSSAREQHFKEMGVLPYFKQKSSPPFIREFNEGIDGEGKYFVNNENNTVFTSLEPNGYVSFKGIVFAKLIRDGFVKKPDFFIFIDDCLNILKKIQQVCNQLNIKFLGIHCTAYSPD